MKVSVKAFVDHSQYKTHDKFANSGSLSLWPKPLHRVHKLRPSIKFFELCSFF